MIEEIFIFGTGAFDRGRFNEPNRNEELVPKLVLEKKLIFLCTLSPLD